MRNPSHYRRVITGLALMLFCAFATSVPAESKTSRGQVLYVPAYSEIPYGDRGYTLNLTVTLSVRNTDRKHPIQIKLVEYHSASGSLVRSYVKEPHVVQPLSSAEFAVKESDRSGGISASFIVEWESGKPVSPPVVETIMISTISTQGISFRSQAVVLEEKHP
ncbi:MAG: DUF3124 domain-containing protein [Deltaproteobacteria bacterium]|nr:DUF3124 domain-containing protein [Deltaproteobacteria bacterium]